MKANGLGQMKMTFSIINTGKTQYTPKSFFCVRWSIEEIRYNNSKVSDGKTSTKQKKCSPMDMLSLIGPPAEPVPTTQLILWIPGHLTHSLSYMSSTSGWTETLSRSLGMALSSAHQHGLEETYLHSLTALSGRAGRGRSPRLSFIYVPHPSIRLGPISSHTHQRFTESSCWCSG